MKIQKLSPLFIVNEIEPCMEFWLRLGFEKTVEVPEGDKLGFIILEKDGVELMYQSMKSLSHDLPILEKSGISKSCIYVEVNGLGEFQKRVPPESIIVPLRKTFYGAQEIFVREPAGNVVGFSERV